MKQLKKFSEWVHGWQDDLQGPKGKMKEWEDESYDEKKSQRVLAEEKTCGLPEDSETLPTFLSIKGGIGRTLFLLALVSFEIFLACTYAFHPKDECVYSLGVILFFCIFTLYGFGSFMIYWYPRVELATRRGMKRFYTYWFVLYASACIISALLSLTPLWCQIWKKELVETYVTGSWYSDYILECPEKYFPLDIWTWIFMMLYALVSLSSIGIVVKKWILSPGLLDGRLKYMDCLTKVQSENARKRAEKIKDLLWKIECKEKEISEIKDDIERLKKEGEVEVESKPSEALAMGRQERRLTGCLTSFLVSSIMLIATSVFVICNWDEISTWWMYYKEGDIKTYWMQKAMEDGTFKPEDWYTPEELAEMKAWEYKEDEEDGEVLDTISELPSTAIPSASPKASASGGYSSSYSSSYSYSRMHEDDYDDDDDDDDDTWYRGDDDPDEYYEYDFHE